MGSAKTKTVDAYLAALPKEDRVILRSVRATIKSVAPKATEKMSYGMPMFFYGGMFIAYAKFKNHYSLFAMSPQLRNKFKKELKNFKTSKGTIQFTKDNPLSKTLIRKIVQERIKEKKAHGKL